MRLRSVFAIVLLWNAGSSMCVAQGKQAPAKNLGTKTMEKAIDVKFCKKQYVFTLAEVAKGVKFEYQIIVREDIPNVWAKTQRTADGDDGKSKLHAFPMISGNNQRYCIRDVGLGLPPRPNFQMIKKGKYKRSFAWTGRNWNGPSDTGAPLRNPFPPGKYKLSVSFVGFVKTSEGPQQYRVERSVDVVLKKN